MPRIWQSFVLSVLLFRICFVATVSNDTSTDRRQGPIVTNTCNQDLKKKKSGLFNPLDSAGSGRGRMPRWIVRGDTIGGLGAYLLPTQKDPVACVAACLCRPIVVWRFNSRSAVEAFSPFIHPANRKLLLFDGAMSCLVTACIQQNAKLLLLCALRSAPGAFR